MTTLDLLPLPGSSALMEISARSSRDNTTPLAELLTRAKAAIEVGYDSWRQAAEALAAAQDQHGVTQVEMAAGIDKSPAWVSQLLSWRRSGYKSEGPFGPTTKAGRLQHAEALTVGGASRRHQSRKASTESADAPCAEECVADDEKAEAKIAGTAATDGAMLLQQFKAAVDSLFVKLDWSAQQEAFLHVKRKMTPPPGKK
jgi:hypothetical protein